MIVNNITIGLLENKDIKKIGVLDFHSSIIIECRVLKYIKDGDKYILKIKTPKSWTYGITTIYRSLEEVF